MRHRILGALLEALWAAAEDAGDSSTDKTDGTADRRAYRTTDHQTRKSAARTSLEGSAYLPANAASLPRINDSGCRNSEARSRLAERPERAAKSLRKSADTRKQG